MPNRNQMKPDYSFKTMTANYFYNGDFKTQTLDKFTHNLNNFLKICGSKYA